MKLNPTEPAIPISPAKASGKSRGIINAGTYRTASDVLREMGIKNYKAVAAAARVIIAYKSKGERDASEIAAHEIVAFVKENPKLQLSVAMGRNNLGLPQGGVAALHFLMAEDDRVVADQITRHLCMGHGSTTDSAVYELRDNLLRMGKSQKAMLSPAHIRDLLNRAIIADLERPAVHWAKKAFSALASVLRGKAH
jgi:hypothetical protein